MSIAVIGIHDGAIALAQVSSPEDVAPFPAMYVCVQFGCSDVAACQLALVATEGGSLVSLYKFTARPISPAKLRGFFCSRLL